MVRFGEHRSGGYGLQTRCKQRDDGSKGVEKWVNKEWIPGYRVEDPVKDDELTLSLQIFANFSVCRHSASAFAWDSVVSPVDLETMLRPSRRLACLLLDVVSGPVADCSMRKGEEEVQKQAMGQGDLRGQSQSVKLWTVTF